MSHSPIVDSVCEADIGPEPTEVYLVSCLEAYGFCKHPAECLARECSSHYQLSPVTIESSLLLEAV